MEKEESKKKKLIKKILIGAGIAGVSIFAISLIRRNQKKNECQNLRLASEPALKTTCPPASKTVRPKASLKKNKPKFNDKATVRECNKLLKKLWESGNPDNKLYYDDEVYVDVMGWSPLFISDKEWEDLF